MQYDEDNMTDITKEFDNLSSVMGDVKDFDQSKEEGLNLFDVPAAYQEFDEIENQIDTDNQVFDEINLYSNRLRQSQVVRRDDVLALESIAGSLESLPHINSYTQEYSLVNYTVTQESVFARLREVTGDILKGIWTFILNSLKHIYDHVKGLFISKAYSNPTKFREEVKKTQTKAQESVKKAQGKSAGTSDVVVVTTVSITSSHNVNDNSQRVNKINVKLRSLLYPAFSELKVLSRGGDINVDLLIDEMCEQRFKHFYTTFFKAIYEKDYIVPDFLRLYTKMMNDDVSILARRTQDFHAMDLSKPLSDQYAPQYTVAPEQIKEFVKAYGAAHKPHGEVIDQDKEFKIMASIAYAAARDMVNIRVTHDLPEPRTILNLDLDSLAILDVVTVKTVENIDKNYKQLRKVKSEASAKYSNIAPENKPSVNSIYSDWLILNRAMMTTTLFLTRINSITKNYKTLMDYIIKVVDIVTE